MEIYKILGFRDKEMYRDWLRFWGKCFIGILCVTPIVISMKYGTEYLTEYLTKRKYVEEIYQLKSFNVVVEPRTGLAFKIERVPQRNNVDALDYRTQTIFIKEAIR